MLDYPYTTVSARLGDALVNISLKVASESVDVTEESIVTLVRDHLAALPGVTVPRSIRREVTETVT